MYNAKADEYEFREIWHLALVFEDEEKPEKNYLRAIECYLFLFYVGYSDFFTTPSSIAFNLGILYDRIENYKNSVLWYKKSAELDEPAAMFNIAMAYGQGNGVLASKSASIDWYYKAAVQYLKNKDREMALTAYDRIKAIDEKHLVTKKLEALLFDF